MIGLSLVMDKISKMVKLVYFINIERVFDNIPCNYKLFQST